MNPLGTNAHQGVFVSDKNVLHIDKRRVQNLPILTCG